MRGLVRNYSIGAGSGKSIKVPIYPVSAAYSLTEGQDITANTITTSSATLTVSEVGIMASVTDMSRVSSSSDVISDIGRVLGEAIARKMDQDLTSNFASFTTNVLGNVTAATATITASDIFKATAKLRSIGVPAGDLYCVLHPSIAYDLKANLTAVYSNPNAGVVQNEAMAMGYLGMLAGVPVYETSNVNNNGTTGDFVGGLFHRDALGLAMMQDIRIETQRDASLRADEIVATAMYGHGVLYESNGVALGFDSSIL
jgi:N4-gp56 family major capsid protein